MARPQCHIPLIIIFYETSNLVKITELWNSKTFALGHFHKSLEPIHF
jgi:hypothetical protein